MRKGEQKERIVQMTKCWRESELRVVRKKNRKKWNTISMSELLRLKALGIVDSDGGINKKIPYVGIRIGE